MIRKFALSVVSVTAMTLLCLAQGVPGGQSVPGPAAEVKLTIDEKSQDQTTWKMTFKGKFSTALNSGPSVTRSSS